MPWFWGSKSKNEEDYEDASPSEDDEYDSEEYTDEEEEDTEAQVDDGIKDGEDGQAPPSNSQSDPGDAHAPMSKGEETNQAPAVKEASSAHLNGHLPDEENESSSSGEYDDDVGEEFQKPLKSDDAMEGSTKPSVLASNFSANVSDCTHDENVSMIESDGLHSEDEGYLDTTDEEDGVSDSDEEEEDYASPEDPADAAPEEKLKASQASEVLRVETVDENESNDDEDEESDAAKEQLDDESEEEEEGPTSFWEKQSLLALAAEHDRVDILKGILTDDEQETSSLMNSGIPPLHIAISFGSTNTTQSLLRMGADPSIRPNVFEVKKQAKEAPEGSKLEIPNLARFDGVSAWELAFGNAAYEEQQKSKSSWSVFNSSSSNVSMSTRTNGGADRIIKPVDMAPSKREGIRHAFTAEALRCIGGDEVERLEQLLNSGMPASIDIGGKTLYDWAVQLGGMKCEECLRPTEAAKYGSDTSQNIADDLAEPTTPAKPTNGSKPSTPKPPSSFGKVLDRPGEDMTVPLLINRLDELESLASALSTCLDSLAEEVSVCHGLLLLGGGASALASHVKSLKTLQAQKRTQLSNSQVELEQTEQELIALVQSSGSIGEEVVLHAPNRVQQEYSRTESFRVSTTDDPQTRQQLLAQIAASENKILKLRASIADLSQENTKEMEQVEKRGLTGGINLVRTLREELRDFEFQWTETKNRMATCRAQIGTIKSRMLKSDNNIPEKKAEATPLTDEATAVESTNSIVEDEGMVMVESEDAEESEDEDAEPHPVDEDEEDESVQPSASGESLFFNENGSAEPSAEKASATSSGASRAVPAKQHIPPEPVKPQVIQGRPAPALPGHVEVKRKGIVPIPETENNTDSERVATGDSQALVVRPSGNRGYFTVDLWQVILRIIGLDNAANRRGALVTQKQKGNTANLMIV